MRFDVMKYLEKFLDFGVHILFLSLQLCPYHRLSAFSLQGIQTWNVWSLECVCPSSSCRDLEAQAL